MNALTDPHIHLSTIATFTLQCIPCIGNDDPACEVCTPCQACYPCLNIELTVKDTPECEPW